MYQTNPHLYTTSLIIFTYTYLDAHSAASFLSLFKQEVEQLE